MNNLEKNFKEAKSASDYAKRYLTYLNGLLSSLDTDIIAKISDILDKARLDGRRIFMVGNGGSAATAYHYVNDFGVGCLMDGKKPFRIMALTDNVPNVTALANDTGYENIFVGQMRGLFDPKDVLVALSVSGNSPNVVKAVEYAKKVGGYTIGLVGFDGGQMLKMCDLSLLVKTEKGEYGPVEDIHLVLDHLISSYLKYKIMQGAQ